MDPNPRKQRVRVRYEETFKRDCVDLLEKSGKTLKEMAEELGLKPWTLRDWRQEYRPMEVVRLPEEKESELVRLRRENESLRAQRDVLKKALGILAEESGSATRG